VLNAIGPDMPVNEPMQKIGIAHDINLSLLKITAVKLMYHSRRMALT
jgi:hypothetical protein